MKVYVFGNDDFEADKTAFIVARKLRNKMKNIEFIEVNANQDVPFEEKENVVILDSVMGIEKVEEIKDEDLEKLILNKSITAHDYDLGFQIKYLQKIGKIGSVTIVGLPIGREIDYFRIQSILRKLVAQDMHGS